MKYPVTMKIKGKLYRLDFISGRYVLSYSSRSHRIDKDDSQFCGWICDCEDFAFRREELKSDPCKHIEALWKQGHISLSEIYIATINQ
jgi:hypothetical protein